LVSGAVVAGAGHLVGEDPGYAQGVQGVALRVLGLVIGRDADVADELAGGRRQVHLGE